MMIHLARNDTYLMKTFVPFWFPTENIFFVPTNLISIARELILYKIGFKGTKIASEGLKGRVFEVSLADLQADTDAER